MDVHHEEAGHQRRASILAYVTSRQGETVYIREIAEAEGITQGTAFKHVAKMVVVGMLENPPGRRKGFVLGNPKPIPVVPGGLAERGLKILARANHLLDQAMKKLGDAKTVSDAQEAYALLEDLREFLRGE